MTKILSIAPLSSQKLASPAHLHCSWDRHVRRTTLLLSLLIIATNWTGCDDSHPTGPHHNDELDQSSDPLDLGSQDLTLVPDHLDQMMDQSGLLDAQLNIDSGSDATVDPAILYPNEPGGNPLDPTHALYPFPSDFFYNT